MFFGSGGRSESNSHQLARIIEKKIFLQLDGTSCLESRNQMFFGSRGRSESNSHQLARIGEKKIFHELDAHHASKVGIKRFFVFLAQEAEMTLTAISSLYSARRKFFMNSTESMCKNFESNVFGTQEAKVTLTAISSHESARRKFFMNSTYIMSRKWESNVFRLRRPNEVQQPIDRSNRREDNFT